MTVTLTHGAVVMSPQLVVDGYQWARASQLKEHWPLAGSSPDVTGRPARLRRGKLRLLFGTAAAATQCESEHAAAPGVSFRLVDSKLPAASMYYRPAEGGSTSVRPDPASGRWVVEIDYQETTGP